MIFWNNFWKILPSLKWSWFSNHNDLKDLLDLKEHKTKTVSTEFLYEMNKINDDTYVIHRPMSDDKILESFKVSPPLPVRKPSYYRILKDG